MTGRAAQTPGNRRRLLRTGCRLLFWLTLLVVAFVTLSPIADRPDTPFGPDAERFAAFALISGLATLAYPAHRLRWFWATVAVAAALEAGQNLVGGRHGRLVDFEVKTWGAVAGTLLALGLERVASGSPPVAPAIPVARQPQAPECDDP